MKFFVLRKNSIICGVICFILAILSICIVTTSFNRSKETLETISNRKIPIYCVDQPDKTIAISFDAAWANG